MKILVQTNNRKQVQLEHEFKKLEESGFETIPFGYLLKDNTLFFTGLEDIDLNEPYVVRANIQVIRELCVKKTKSNLDLSKTIDYNSRRFDSQTLPQCPEFLNKTADKYVYLSLSFLLGKRFNTDLFVKPSDDLKLFSGTLLPKGEPLKYVLKEKKELKDYSKEELGSMVLTSSNLLELFEEVRCYVVNKKVVTLSRYRMNDKYDTSALFRNEVDEYIRYAQHIVNKIYAPSDNFTIDICRDIYGKKYVMEYNCLTASGLYECNTKELFSALKDYYYER